MARLASTYRAARRNAARSTRAQQMKQIRQRFGLSWKEFDSMCAEFRRQYHGEDMRCLDARCIPSRQ